MKKIFKKHIEEHRALYRFIVILFLAAVFGISMLFIISNPIIWFLEFIIVAYMVAMGIKAIFYYIFFTGFADGIIEGLERDD